MLSTPPAPVIVSAPLPPSSRSLPAPPVRRSFPSRPSNVTGRLRRKGHHRDCFRPPSRCRPARRRRGCRASSRRSPRPPRHGHALGVGAVVRGVGAGAAGEHVRSRPAGQVVVVALALEGVGAAAAAEDVVAGPAPKLVRPPSPVSVSPAEPPVMFSTSAAMLSRDPAAPSSAFPSLVPRPGRRSPRRGGSHSSPCRSRCHR